MYHAMQRRFVDIIHDLRVDLFNQTDRVNNNGEKTNNNTFSFLKGTCAV
jgi:hypothetical protein